ncbi:hypothetical protein [Microbacterium gorillae]|uniref:hypothetical protein n=1 Tax=Microbacterium gorillae TaxID=1231063 RepID=UPI003D969E99
MADAQKYQPDVLWACVEDGFHVGSRGGDFLGFVDRRPDGGYRAYDSRSQTVGDYPSLREATAAVTRAQPGTPIHPTTDVPGATS